MTVIRNYVHREEINCSEFRETKKALDRSVGIFDFRLMGWSGSLAVVSIGQESKKEGQIARKIKALGFRIKNVRKNLNRIFRRLQFLRINSSGTGELQQK